MKTRLFAIALMFVAATTAIAQTVEIKGLRIGDTRAELDNSLAKYNQGTRPDSLTGISPRREGIFVGKLKAGPDFTIAGGGVSRLKVLFCKEGTLGAFHVRFDSNTNTQHIVDALSAKYGKYVTTTDVMQTPFRVEVIRENVTWTVDGTTITVSTNDGETGLTTLKVISQKWRDEVDSVDKATADSAKSDL